MQLCFKCFFIFIYNPGYSEKEHVHCSWLETLRVSVWLIKVRNHHKRDWLLDLARSFQSSSKYESQLNALNAEREHRVSQPRLSGVQPTSVTITLQVTEPVPNQRRPLCTLPAQSYSQHQLQLLPSHPDPFQGRSRESSPPAIWFNPDQMLIGLFGCWPSAWAAGQLWQAVPSCAVPGLPAKVSAAQRPLHEPEDTSQPIVHTYCEQTPWWVIRSNWSFHDLWGSLSISHSHTHH